ncbi:hypothetical protein PQX77_009064 [Marasmius sp. AFHP31]|nr:hypothetical protein PQX77_009064 [Marasmius sp. AFHP31]
MLPVRFSTTDEDGKDVFDAHIVLWISVHPNTTKETSCRDANTEILAILAKHGIQDAAVHWIEGAAEPLDGPLEIMCVVQDMNPTYYELADNDVQGSLGLYFYEGKDRQGNESTQLMALTNKHVVSKHTDQDYEFSGRPGAQYIRNCGRHRLEKVVDETRALVAKKLRDTELFAEQLAETMTKPKPDDADEDMDNLERKRQDLNRVEKDVATLSDFFQLLNSTWSPTLQRVIGWLDWAPKIANDLDSRCYTRDLGVIALNESKFTKNYKGNVVYLAGKYTREEIVSFFYPNVASPPVFNYPTDHLFRLSGTVDAAGLANLHFWDDQGNPCFIVAKSGQSSDLTFGRFSELEAYVCDKFKNQSFELAVLNYGKNHGNFSEKGDSGSAVFNAEGKVVAILHSGMPRGMSNHITFGTPARYVVECIKERYPHTDFERLKFWSLDVYFFCLCLSHRCLFSSTPCILWL